MLLSMLKLVTVPFFCRNLQSSNLLSHVVAALSNFLAPLELRGTRVRLRAALNARCELFVWPPKSRDS